MSVQHKRLGAHGALVSNLCLGTMNFGWVTSEEDSFRIMDRALELGINFFDTADVYGWAVEHGADRGDHRPLVRPRRRPARGGDACHQSLQPGDAQGQPARAERRRPQPLGGQDQEALRRQPAAPADRLDRPLPDAPRRPCCPWDETWQAFDSLVQQGKVVYVGSSNFAGWDIATACQEASRRGMTGLVSEQSIYSLNNRMIELEVIPACRHYGLGLIPWSPLAGGLLGGALEKAQAGRRMEAKFAKQVETNRPSSSATRRSARNWANSRRRGPGLAAAQPGGHRADHRTAHAGAARKRRARHRDRAGCEC